MSENDKASAVMVARSVRVRAAQRDVAGADGGAHMSDTVGHQSAVLGREQHHIAHGAEGGDLGEGAPQLRLAQALTQHLHELERHAGTCQLAAGAGGGKLRVGHRNAARHQVGRLVVVGHDDIHATLDKVANLLGSGDAVVDRHDQAGVALGHHALEGGARKAVALVETARDKRGGIGAKRAQRLGEQARRGDAVHIEITEHGYGRALAHGALNTGGDPLHTGNDQRVGPITIERGSEEQPPLLHRGDPARRHDARHQRRDVQLLGELGLERGVARGKRPAVCG